MIEDVIIEVILASESRARGRSAEVVGIVPSFLAPLGRFTIESGVLVCHCPDARRDEQCEGDELLREAVCCTPRKMP